ncbi:uncharacterized protein J4E92_008374 [Alternaria infectoria]|uniref:uncharacterized protein n=1 Tax=Alternaria infectoria TaxID=45303 RepID=UPI002220255C|nr:uncharacterized protein J4E92_008374 [Alternaria infectoria]KAI4920730.1 hypothetical protein J4E92_008374 [Alternaria infectoria]
MGSKTHSAPLQNKLQELLDRRRTNATLRNLTLPLQNQTDFSSNDFLSLSTSPQLKSEYLQELQRIDVPLGSGGSRLLDGNSTYAEQLEQEIASFHGAASGLLFNSGFDANAGFFASVPQPGDVIVYDELVHASVHDGMRLSRAGKTIAFEHNSISALQNALIAVLGEDEGVRDKSCNVFVALESIYSMDGDVCPLKEMVEVVEEVLGPERGYIVMDEAHSTGVLGPEGRGLVCELGLEKRIFARLHTFGKAVAANGGTSYIVLSKSVIAHTLFVPVTPVWPERETTSPSTESYPASLYQSYLSPKTIEIGWSSTHNSKCMPEIAHIRSTIGKTESPGELSADSWDDGPGGGTANSAGGNC